MTCRRWMALFFALGSTCFLIGPFPGYAQLVGETADAVTFFVGSILFTIGGALQSWLAWPERRIRGGGRAAWWSAIVQSAGTLFFNVTTYQAMHVALTSTEYDKLVWRPDWRGRSASSSQARSPTLARRDVDGMDACRPVVAKGGGSQPSTCSGASSSESRRSQATSFPRPARSSIWPQPTGTRRSEGHVSLLARWTLCTPTERRRCRYAASFARSNAISRASRNHGADLRSFASVRIVVKDHFRTLAQVSALGPPRNPAS
jgi:hypothetical protein